MKYFRRRGFGIHSPFAFRFITEVVREKNRYYDYDILTDKNQRLLYRLATFLQPCQIETCGNGDCYPAVLACPPRDRKATVWTTLDATKLAVAGPTATQQEVDSLLDDDWVVFSYLPCTTTCQSNMVFAFNHGPTIIFPWHHLPPMLIRL